MAAKNSKSLLARIAGNVSWASKRNGSTGSPLSPSLWNVAGAFTHADVVGELLNILNAYGVKRQVLAQSHDCLPGMIWNGGRTMFGMYPSGPGGMTIDTALETVAQFNRFGVAFFLTFSNHLLREEHLADSRCNRILDGISADPRNGVICSSDLLFSHIRNRFPAMPVKLSVIPSYVERIWTRPTGEIRDWYMRKLDQYDMVCLNPNLNKSTELLDSLPLDRIEVMVSLHCDYQCPFAGEHYTLSARANLEGMANWDLMEEELGFCKRKHGETGKRAKYSVQLSRQTVDWLKEIGVSHFKIHGKTDDYWRLLLHINHYILNPEGLHFEWQKVNGATLVTCREVGRHEFEQN